MMGQMIAIRILLAGIMRHVDIHATTIKPEMVEAWYNFTMTVNKISTDSRLINYYEID